MPLSAPKIKQSPFSTIHMLVFALAFGVIGLVLWRSFAAPNPNLQGDLNGDNTVNITDLSILLSDYNTANPAADINADGTVNILDLSILLSHFGQSYTPPAATAHVWIATDGNDSCTRNSSTVDLTTAYADGNVCLTFNRAYSQAQQGDTVLVNGGTYQGQTINYDATKTAAAGNCRLSYNGDGTFGEDDSGCVTIEPAPGQAVNIGCKTSTTAAIDMTSSTSIPVVSTAGCPTAAGASTWSPHLNGSFTCTGIDATDFTGCTPQGSGCYESGGNVLCHYNSGATVMVGGLSDSGASYLKVKGITMGNSVSADHDTNNHNVTDVVYDGITASWGFIRGSQVWFENSLVGDNNVGSQNLKFSSCGNCGAYHSTFRNASEDTCPLAQHADCHSEDIYLDTESNFYLVGSVVYGSGSSANLFFSYGSSGNPGPITLVNNYFGTPCSPGGSCNEEVNINAQGNNLDSYTIEGNSSSSTWTILGVSGTNNFTNWQVIGNIGIGFPCTKPANISTYGVTIQYNVDSGTACSSASSPTASNNVGGVTTSSLWTNASIGNLDLTGGPYVWENTWASCPLGVDFHGTSRPATCTPGGYQR